MLYTYCCTYYWNIPVDHLWPWYGTFDCVTMAHMHLYFIDRFLLKWILSKEHWHTDTIKKILQLWTATHLCILHCKVIVATTLCLNDEFKV